MVLTSLKFRFRFVKTQLLAEISFSFAETRLPLETSFSGSLSNRLLQNQTHQHFLHQKAHHAQAEHKKRHGHAEFAGTGFFAQVPNDEADEDNQHAEADFYFQAESGALVMMFPLLIKMV